METGELARRRGKDPPKLEEALLLVLAQSPKDLRGIVHVLLGHDLVYIVGHERSVDEEGDDLEREQEARRQERVRDHLWQDELRVDNGTQCVSLFWDPPIAISLEDAKRTWLSLLQRSIGFR